MITRRRVVAGSNGALLLASVAGRRAFAAAEAAAEPLIALPGKQPLIRRTFHHPTTKRRSHSCARRSLPTTLSSYAITLRRFRKPTRVPGVCASAARARSARWSCRSTSWSETERVRVVAVNQCSGNRRGLFTPRAAGVQWSYGAMGNALWGGVRLRDVLDRVGVKGDALEVVFDGADQAALPGTPDFVKSLPVDRALDEHTLIAFEMNGEPLPHWHGAPARLVVAGWTATYWVKHLTSISVAAESLRWLLDEERLSHPDRRLPRRALCEPGECRDNADHGDSHQLADHQPRQRRSPAARSTRRACRLGVGRRERHRRCRALYGRRTLLAIHDAGRSAKLVFMARISRWLWIRRNPAHCVLQSAPPAATAPRSRRNSRPTLLAIITTSSRH